MIIVFAFVMVVATPCAHAQITERQIKKEAKKEAKRITKEGWTLYDSSEDLYSSLVNYYQNLQDEDVQGLIGVSSLFMSKNVGKQSAINSACNEYARQAQSFIRDRLIDFEPYPDELDKFYAAYESNLFKEIKSVLKPSFTIIRSNGMRDGNETFEMQTFFLVNEKEASKVRLAAMQKAIEETCESCQQYTERIAKLVQEGFQP